MIDFDKITIRKLMNAKGEPTGEYKIVTRNQSEIVAQRTVDAAELVQVFNAVVTTEAWDESLVYGPGQDHFVKAQT